MITERYFHCFTQLNEEFLIATGGCLKGSAYQLRSCEVYNIRNNSWHSVTPMQKARYYHAAVQVQEGILFVFAGRDEADKYHDTIERFCNNSSSWSTINTDIKLPPRRFPHAVAIDDGAQVVIFGGSDNQKTLSDVYVLQTDSYRLELCNNNTGVGLNAAY